MAPPDDVLLNKAAIVERSIRRIREEFAADPTLEHPTHRDALTLNIERACQARGPVSCLLASGHLLQR